MGEIRQIGITASVSASHLELVVTDSRLAEWIKPCCAANETRRLTAGLVFSCQGVGENLLLHKARRDPPLKHHVGPDRRLEAANRLHT